MRTILVEDYMTPSPYSVDVAQTVGDSRSLMRTHKIRHLPVLDGKELVGVVTDRDVRGLDADVRLDSVMSATPYTVSPTTPLEVAARHMARHKLGSCVVMEANEVIGMLTTTDGMRALAELLDVAEQLPPRLARAAAPAPSPSKRDRR
jgi:acetoin utilization protein AcuB